MTQNLKKHEKISKLHKKTAIICDNKKLKLIHGQKTFSSNFYQILAEAFCCTEKLEQ